MEKIVIGIPKALLYYKYHYLWEAYFKALGCEVIYSEKSNKELLKDGISLSQDEMCLSLKLFLGHVKSLINKCDYVLVPRICSPKKGEKTCTNFYALYDIVHNIFPDVSVLNYNIDYDHNVDEKYAFIDMGIYLGFRYKECLEAYRNAKKIEAYKERMLISKQNEVLKSKRKKILLVAHSYNCYDDLIGENISSFLIKNGMDVIYADIYDKSNLEEECSLISKSIYWTYNKELLGAVSKYKDSVDGIILLSTFPCGPDSLVNDLVIRKVKNVPIITIVMDEGDGLAGLITRLESFVDIINVKDFAYEK